MPEVKKPVEEEVAETPEEDAVADEGFADDETAAEEEGYEDGEEEGFDDGEEMGEEEFAEGDGFDEEFPDDPSLQEDPMLDPLAQGLPEEPLGASILRRVFEDHSILMRDYDEMSGLLEQPKVKMWVVKKLMVCEQTLDECERLFAGLYPDLPPLSEDSNGDAADADGFEEEPGLAEGDEGFDEEPTTDEGGGEELDTESPSGDDVDGAGGEGEGQTGPASKGPEDPPEEAVQGMRKGKKSLSDTMTKAYDGDFTHNKDEVSDHAPHTLPLKEHEKEYAKKAQHFLEETSGEEALKAWGLAGQKNAFHHCMTLSDIAMKGGNTCSHCGKGLKDSKCIECSAKGLEESEHHPHRKACGEVSSWLEELSHKRAPGMKDGEKCMECAKSLSVFNQEKADDDDEEGGGEKDIHDAHDGHKEPGDIDEKDMDEDDEGMETKGIKKKYKGKKRGRKSGEEYEGDYAPKKTPEQYRSEDRANAPRSRGMSPRLRSQINGLGASEAAAKKKASRFPPHIKESKEATESDPKNVEHARKEGNAAMKRASSTIKRHEIERGGAGKYSLNEREQATRTAANQGRGAKSGDDMAKQTKALIEENERQQKGLSSLNSTLERLLKIV